MSPPKYRLVTRSDFDGLVCAVLLKELKLIDEIRFVHPKDMQDGKVAVGPRDITTNLPYVPGPCLVFDHHLSESVRTGKHRNHILEVDAPSAARVVYDHYGGKAVFAGISDAMMAAVDKADSAQFTPDEILAPSGWVLLSFLMDARTGLGRFHDFRISNYALMMDLIDCCRDRPVEAILQLPDVQERVELYFRHAALARDQILRCARVHGKLVVLDLRGEETLHAVNRFVIYTLFPHCNMSIHVFWGAQRQGTVLAVGKSIVDRSSRTDVGQLMLHHGGGGHRGAGTCQCENAKADALLRRLIKRIGADG
ncbi:MAG: exopolyphosphatase [Pseudomonadota bacterium]|nr:exopolyphosphatase [Pseudomonadota bacterium]